MKKSGNGGSNVLGKLSDSLGLSKSVYGGAVEISLENNEKMYINYHRGLVCADENLIIIRGTENLSIRVIGTGLCIDAISESRAFITGKIKEIGF